MDEAGRTERSTREGKNVEGREGQRDLSSWSPKGKGKGKLTVRSDDSPNSDKL
jgi:hypothetical protein